MAYGTKLAILTGLLAVSGCTNGLQYNVIPEDMRQLGSNTVNTACPTDDAKVP